MYKIDRHRHRACLPPHLSPVNSLYIIKGKKPPRRARACKGLRYVTFCTRLYGVRGTLFKTLR
jgi:hypothetical protein